MKNEDRILELLAETLQRMDQYSERFDKWQQEMKQLREEANLQREEMKLQREEMKIQQEAIRTQQETMQLQMGVNTALLTKIQQQDNRLAKHEDGIDKLRERADLFRESALEQQKAYREMTELLLFHNTALRAKNIL